MSDGFQFGQSIKMRRSSSLSKPPSEIVKMGERKLPDGSHDEANKQQGEE